MAEETRILVVGDLHVTDANVKQVDILQKMVINLLQERKPRHLVFLGDTLHYMEWINQQSIKRALNLFKECAKYVQVTVLIGNHDIINAQYEGDMHAFYCVEIPNVTFVWQPHWLDENFLAIPYKPVSKFRETLELVEDWELAKAIFAHQEFKGGILRKGEHKTEYSTEGDEVPNGPLIISGHLHDAHEYGNVIYVGTPYATRFGEDEDKAISMFTWMGDEYTYERIPLPVPAKRTLHLTIKQLAEGPSEDADPTTTRVFVQGTTDELKTLRYTKGYEEWLKKGIEPLARYADTYVAVKQKGLQERAYELVQPDDHKRLRAFFEGS